MIQIGDRVKDLIRKNYHGSRYRDRGLGTVLDIHPGCGRGHLWPYYLVIKWDQGWPEKSDRTIDNVARDSSVSRPTCEAPHE